MEAVDIINVTRESLWVLILIGAPIMITGLVIGLTVSFVQALTQIQETTLTFVPKLFAMLFVMALSLPYMLQKLQDFSSGLFERIANIQ
jgi:flagellar biosynthesis protein FliQ